MALCSAIALFKVFLTCHYDCCRHLKEENSVAQWAGFNILTLHTYALI